MFIDSEHLLVKDVLRNSVVIIQGSLGTPAYEHVAVYVSLGKLKDFTQLRPEIDLLEIHKLNRGSRNNHSVKILILELLKGGIKSLQVILGCMC